MFIPRIYQQDEYYPQQLITLDEKNSHYVLHVLRLKANAQLILFNGKGGEYSAKIYEIKKQKALVLIEAFHPKEIESSLDIHLGQAISRGDKMDFTLQKAVELGVKEITPLFTEYCGVKLSSERLERRMGHWYSIIIAACEQSGRNTLPVLYPPCTLEAWLNCHKFSCGVVLNPHQGQSLKTIHLSKHQTIAIVVGAESGLSLQEINFTHSHQFVDVQLGPRILRTETAALTMLAALQTLWGDF